MEKYRRMQTYYVRQITIFLGFHDIFFQEKIEAK